MDLGQLREQRLDEIEISHRYAAACDHDVTRGDSFDERRPEGGRVVWATPRPDDFRARFLQRRDQAETVCISDLSGTGYLVGLNQLVSGRQDAHSGTPHDLHRVDSQTGQ